MEIHQSKSAAEDEMEMMMMMDKFPDFYAACNDVSDLSPPPPEFPANIPSNSIPHFIDSSPPFIDLPSNLPLITNTHFHEDSHSPSPSPSPSLLLLNPTATRWRGSGVGEFAACANDSQKKNSMAAMREMIFRMAAMQPIHIDPESVKPPKRRNVKISKDPQSVAARHRRERISERIRILQRLVPGGTKMDTASMLDEAIHYVKFLKTQVQSLERAQANRPSPPPRPPPPSAGIGFPVTMSSGSYLPAMGKAYGQQQLHPRHHNVQHYGDG